MQWFMDAPVLALLDRLMESSLGDVSLDGVDPVGRKKLGKILHWTYTFHIQGYTLPQALKLIPKGPRDNS